MAIITKEEAESAATEFKAKLVDRASQYLVNLAKSGQVGGEIAYSVEAEADIQKTIDDLTVAGWTVVDDPKKKTLTIL